MNEPQNRPSAMALGSASGSTMPASLPPSSSVSRLSEGAALSMILRPVAIDPVKVILPIPGCRDIDAATSFSQVMTLTTPGGTTSLMISTRRIVDSGVLGDGLIIIVLPARTAGMMCQQAIITGQFQGVIEPTTPIGLRCSSTRPSGLSCSTSTGNSISAVGRGGGAGAPPP